MCAHGFSQHAVAAGPGLLFKSRVSYMGLEGRPIRRSGIRKRPLEGAGQPEVKWLLDKLTIKYFTALI